MTTITPKTPPLVTGLPVVGNLIELTSTPKMRPFLTRAYQQHGPVFQLTALGRKIMVRCNLTIIEANPRYHDLPDFYATHGVEVISSLPFYEASRTDRQRGRGVFEASVRALQRLNATGYGQPGSGLMLQLVYNPAGAFLPPDETALEADFKRILHEKHGIVFNRLLAITNLPISRYLEYLLRSENLESYMETLVQAYNPAAAERVMCRSTLSVGYDGILYDCDFNQMLELPVSTATSRHIADFQEEILNNRRIVTGPHCYGCTAGAGSSCGGSLTTDAEGAETGPVR